jgi:hypothetical protein
MSIVLVGSTSGSITLQEPAVAGTTVLDLPATSGTVVVTGTTPTLNGITFPATAVPSADANTLDDYEEGTWTPAATSGFTVVGGITVATGSYTKIGNMVYARGLLTAGTSISATSAYITGLPFNPTAGRPSANGGIANDGTGAPIGSAAVFPSGNFYVTNFSGLVSIGFAVTYQTT